MYYDNIDIRQRELAATFGNLIDMFSDNPLI